MLRGIKELIGYEARGRDDVLGEVRDIFFDDAVWHVRYLVIDTGVFLPGRKVLLPTTEIEEPLWEDHAVAIDVTRGQVKGSPEIDADRPVSRQQEAELHSFFRWAPYWAPYGMTSMGHTVAVPVGRSEEEPPATRTGAASPEGGVDDPHLRSLREVTGYKVSAIDGDFGEVDDFIADTNGWAIRYAVIDTRKWLPSPDVLLDTGWITGIDWSGGEVSVSLDKETIREAPKYERGDAVDAELEQRLRDHYGTPAEK